MKKSNMSKEPSSFQKFLKCLGPGLIFAGTSIGVSHIVQSTRAGALFGFGLLWAVILANVVKFPFFTFAPRYVAATGEHLLQGYRRVGNWVFLLFFGMSLLTMLPIQSAVTMVCTGLFANLLHWPFPPVAMAALILLICCIILLAGKYPLLDSLMKVMILFLGVSTIVAFGAAWAKGYAPQPQFENAFQWHDIKDISFVIALMGWMPTTLEIAVWHSFWTVERKSQTNHHPDIHHALFDFHIGYWGTMIMAIFFVGLGAFVMYGTGAHFSDSAVGFTAQVINLYTGALGPWSKWVIGTAAATTMFSTTICCLDAFPRVIREALIMINPAWEGRKEEMYVVFLVLISIASTVIIGCYVSKLKTLVDFATTLAFVATPVFAYMNLRVITGAHMPEGTKPCRAMIAFSWLCLALLTAFALFFIVWRFFLH